MYCDWTLPARVFAANLAGVAFGFLLHCLWVELKPTPSRSVCWLMKAKYYIFTDLTVGDIAVKARGEEEAKTLAKGWLAERIKDGVDGYDHASWAGDKASIERGHRLEVKPPAVYVGNRCCRWLQETRLDVLGGPVVQVVAEPCRCYETREW